jgi:hypothetical protein
MAETMTSLGKFCNLRSQSNASPSFSKTSLRGVARRAICYDNHRNAYNVLYRFKNQLSLPHSSQINSHAATASNTTPSPLQLEQQIASLSSAQQILDLLEQSTLDELMSAAVALRDQGHPFHIITFSPKVFIPLTRLCRDSCGYCTFAQGPVPGHRVYMTIEEVLTVARMGAEQGCTEALFTLGWYSF